jgi:hypothetical protein
MKIGMLWEDVENKGRDFSTRLKYIAEYYQKKYDAIPDTCYVHPSMDLKGVKNMSVEDISIKTSKAILPGYFWIGRDGDEELVERK